MCVNNRISTPLYLRTPQHHLFLSPPMLHHSGLLRCHSCPRQTNHLQNRVQVHIGTRSVHWSDISWCPSWEEDTSNKRRGGKTIWKGDGGEHAGSTHSRVWRRHYSLPYPLPTLLLRSLLPPTLRQRINSPSHLVLS